MRCFANSQPPPLRGASLQACESGSWSHRPDFDGQRPPLRKDNHARGPNRTQPPQAAPRACYTRGLGFVPRLAWPAPAGTQKLAVQASSQTTPLRTHDHAIAPNRTQPPQAAPRACYTRGLGFVPRLAWPAPAGTRKLAVQASSQTTPLRTHDHAIAPNRTQPPQAAPRACRPAAPRIDASSSRRAAAAPLRPRPPGGRPHARLVAPCCDHAGPRLPGPWMARRP